MSTLYLIDGHTNVILNSEINDVRYSETGEAVLGGNFIVRLPDGISIGDTDPANNVSDLLTKKYAGLLAAHPLYTDIDREDFIDGVDVNVASSFNINTGNRCSTSLAPDGIGSFLSNMVLLASSPTQAVVTFETFSIPMENDIGDRAVRTYTETDPGVVGVCEVSFNNGGTYLATTDGALLNIPVLAQGNQFIFRFTTLNVPSSPRVFLGSWAVLY